MQLPRPHRTLVASSIVWSTLTNPVLSRVSPSEAPEIVQEVLAADEARRLAMLKADAAALAQLLADEVTIVWGDGTTSDKSSILEQVRSGQLQYSAIEYENTNVRLYGEAAVITGLARIRYRDDKKVFQEHSVHVIRVYARRQARWLMVASQTTRTPSR